MTSLPASETPAKAPDSRGRASILVAALTRRAQERYTGALVLAGDPGGVVTMRAGLVVAATTPAAPGPEPLLLRSGRITEAAWSEAFTAAAPDGRFAAELVDRGILGTAAVEVVAQTALVDAVFAMALTGVRTCTVDPAGSEQAVTLFPVVPGMDAERLIREVQRRLVMADTWQELGLNLRSRPRAVASDQGRQEILDRANGRRTARDIAFALGRGLYSVLTDLADLAEDGLIELTTASVGAPPVLGAPDDMPGLPRRQRGESKVNTVLPWRNPPGQ